LCPRPTIFDGRNGGRSSICASASPPVVDRSLDRFGAARDQLTKARTFVDAMWPEPRVRNEAWRLVITVASGGEHQRLALDAKQLTAVDDDVL
jgi:enamine deaminase RidA (YjgF/YER057c/UK114 family)